MEKMSKNQALAWIYKQLREVISSLPTSIEDFIQDIPPGYEGEDEDGETGLWSIIAQADRAADFVLVGFQELLDASEDDCDDCGGSSMGNSEAGCAGCPDERLCFPGDYDEDDEGSVST